MTKFWKILISLGVGFIVIIGIFLVVEVYQIKTNIYYTAVHANQIENNTAKIIDQLSNISTQENNTATLSGDIKNFLSDLNKEITTGSYYQGLPYNMPRPKN